jgi:ABC-type transport system involved in multi-copper enzyme maturation permease subunit
MLTQIAAVAASTFRETVRDRIFYLVGFFGVLLVLSSVVLSPLTIGAQDKIVSDVGLAGMSLLGLLVVLFVGSNMVRKELERRTATTILAKPVSRRVYLLGKFCGLNLTILCMLGIMTVLFLLVLLVTPAGFAPRYLVAVYLTFLELALINAVVLLFSAAVSPVLAAVLSLGVFVIGHLSESLRRFGQLVGSDVQARIADVVYYAVPNLELFNVRGEVVHGATVGIEHVAIATLYGLSYTILLLVLAGSVFARKEFR